MYLRLSKELPQRNGFVSEFTDILTKCHGSSHVTFGEYVWIQTELLRYIAPYISKNKVELVLSAFTALNEAAHEKTHKQTTDNFLVTGKHEPINTRN
jgi:hypothetical protein